MWSTIPNIEQYYKLETEWNSLFGSLHPKNKTKIKNIIPLVSLYVLCVISSCFNKYQNHLPFLNVMIVI